MLLNYLFKEFPMTIQFYYSQIITMFFCLNCYDIDNDFENVDILKSKFERVVWGIKMYVLTIILIQF